MQNLLFCAHTLRMSYVTNTFLLVRSSVRSKQLLCFAHGQGQNSEQKPTTKTFVGFHNHASLFYVQNPINTYTFGTWYPLVFLNVIVEVFEKQIACEIFGE